MILPTAFYHRRIRDNVNNKNEVVLIDQAITGQWTVKVKDTFHGGSRSQPFSLLWVMELMIYCQI